MAAGQAPALREKREGAWRGPGREDRGQHGRVWLDRSLPGRGRRRIDRGPWPGAGRHAARADRGAGDRAGPSDRGAAPGLPDRGQQADGTRTWDEALLSAELNDLLAEDYDLSLIGFDDAELEALLAGEVDPETASREGEDDVPEAPETPISRPGDLWVLGKHRLLCGDATVATDVERLLGDVKPLLMVTDPPYGVEYDPGWRNKAGAAATKRTGKVLNDDRADWREAWALFPGDVAYVWHGALHATTVAESLSASGFNIRSQIIWAKDRSGAEPRRLSLAARALPLCREENRQGPLGWRSQTDDALADRQQGSGC